LSPEPRAIGKYTPLLSWFWGQGYNRDEPVEVHYRDYSPARVPWPSHKLATIGN